MTDWQPIETAPKDGTPILVFLEEELLKGKMAVAFFHKKTGVVGGVFAFDAPKPVAWMPLPDPPKDKP